MPNIPDLKEMLQAGVHFGHRTARWHPKMEEYIFAAKNGVHVIDVEKTQKQLESVLTYAQNVVARGGNIMFVSTKVQAQKLVEEQAKAAGMPYVNTRWLGGTFTNFTEIQRLIKTYLDLKDKREKGELKKYTKLEQLQFDRKIEELDEKIGGISTITKLPEAIFVLDVRNDKTAVVEANKRGVKVIGICDTNVNPDRVDYVIPANDDSMASLTMIAELMVAAINEGKKNGEVKKDAPAATTEEEAVEVAKESKETVDDLDDEMKEQLAKEQLESKK